MGKLRKILLGRLTWSIILIGLQVFLIVYALFLGSVTSVLITRVLLAFSWAMTMVVVNRDENPAYKIGWMLIFMFLPIYGGFFYLLVGNRKLTTRVSRKWMVYTSLYDEGMRNIRDTVPVIDEKDSMLRRQMSYITAQSGFPVWEGTRAKYYPLGEEWYEDLVSEVSRARHFILMEFFIIARGEVWDSLLEILRKKIAEGVEVRLLYDDVGTINHLSRFYDRTLRAMGLKVASFNRLEPHINVRMNCRDHRKVLVVDGNVAFVGGLNLADEYVNRTIRFGHWKDNAVRIEGDAVRNITIMFMQLWVYTSHEELDFARFLPTGSVEGDGFVQPFGDSPLDDRNISENSYMQIISTARRYVWITSPYLALDNEMITMLRIAAHSGVDVRIVVPHIPDKWYAFAVTRSYYRLLVSNGVKLYEYTPGFIHAKTIISDCDVAIVGSINMDYRTFYLNFENGVAFYHASVIRDIEEDIRRTITLSHRVTMEEIMETPLLVRAGRALLRLAAPLL